MKKQLKIYKMSLIGEILGDLVGYLVVDVLCYSLGLIYLWIKNRGRKSFRQIRKETESLSEVGKSLIAKAFAGVMILLLLFFLLAAIYSIFKYGIY